MNWFASIRIALRALRVNKLRSTLTMLGIIIGVASVITMIAVGSGAQARVEEQIKGLGTCADRDHGDHRGDPDDDAEHGQRAAQLVHAQRAQGDPDAGEPHGD